MTANGITLHVGLPKCASSALQGWADANRDHLAAAGLDYPRTPAGLPAPKHQQVVSALMRGNMAAVETLLSGWTAPALLLSSEGLSNHLYDFDPAQLSRLRALFAGRCQTVILMYRDPEEWVDSMWWQCLLNAPRPAFGYGLDLMRAEFAQLPRLQRLLDLDSLGRDLLAAYGAERLVLLDSRADWLTQLQDALGIDFAAAAPAPQRRNVSIGDAEAELMRCLNGSGAAEPLRGRVMALMQVATGSLNDTLMQHRANFGPTLSLHRPELRAALAALRPVHQPAARLAAAMIHQLDDLAHEGAT